MPGPLGKEYLVADWTLYKQALFHLIVNALKFSKPKIRIQEAALTVEVHNVLVKEKDSTTNKYNLFLKTSVHDVGIGITKENLSNLSM